MPLVDFKTVDGFYKTNCCSEFDWLIVIVKSCFSTFGYFIRVVFNIDVGNRSAWRKLTTFNKKTDNPDAEDLESNVDAESNTVRSLNYVISIVIQKLNYSYHSVIEANCTATLSNECITIV